MKHTLRTIAGVSLILFGVIGGFIPVLQGWVFVAAGVAVLGTDHALVQWGVRKLERYAWARKAMDRMGIRKKEAPPPQT